MVLTDLSEAYTAFISTLPNWAQNFISLFLLVLLVVIYDILIWKFYRWIATKNIIELNLNKYNKSEHPFLAKVLAGFFYFLEYIIIIPFLIFIWFGVFTFFLIVLTDKLEVSALLIVSATIIAAIRMTSYYKEELAKDLAKLLPFTLLAVSIINPNFFNIDRIISQISQLPSFFSQILIYLLFIVILEIILRFFDFIFSLFSLHEEVPKESAVVVKQ